MVREMSLLEEMAMAAGVERLVRRRRRRMLFGIERRWALLALLAGGVAITIDRCQDNRLKEERHSTEYPKMAA